MGLALAGSPRSDLEREDTLDRRASAMADEIDTHLGRRLRRRRRLLGLTQQQIAAACGVRFQQIQKYECGANRISAARLWQIAVSLEVAVDYFFEGLPAENRPCENRLTAPGMRVHSGALSLSPVREPMRDASRQRHLDLAK